MSKNELTERVLSYWFGSSRSFYDTHSDMTEKWFMGGVEVDNEVKEEFGDEIEAALKGDHDKMIHATKRDTLALVILLDQFTRNAYRGTAKAFSGDEKAVNITKQIVMNQMEEVKTELKPAERLFLYTPLMHSENVGDQELCVRFIKELVAELKPIPEAQDMVMDASKSIKYAEDHRDTVIRFGRFPHRNEVLGRESTAEELEYLKTANRYGQ